jgi:hypothetical protein
VAVTITSDPVGAEVMFGTATLGATPITVRLPRGSRPIELSLQKDGFVTERRTITPEDDRSLEVKLGAVPPRPPPAASGKQPSAKPLDELAPVDANGRRPRPHVKPPKKRAPHEGVLLKPSF